MEKKVILGKHCSPSAPPEVIDEGILWKVKMSCGGGFGGTSWNEYGQFIDELKPSKIVRFKDHFTGEEKFLNTSYIVTAQTKKYVSIKSDLSLNEYIGKDGHYSIRTYIMGTSTDYEVIDKCNIEPDKKDAVLINTTYTNE